jgi:hypothetical protein
MGVGFLIAPRLVAQAPREKLLSSENAYNPIPSPDGKLIAYVRTGWGRQGGSGGVGRSNLVSEVLIMDSEGRPITNSPISDSFLDSWSPTGDELVLYRDSKYSIVTLKGRTVSSGERRNLKNVLNGERVFYLPGTKTIGWSRVGKGSGTILETRDRIVATHAGWIGDHVVPSPDGRYLAAFGNETPTRLFIYDMQLRVWSDLGKMTVHPSPDWDYIKPTWNLWFADSSRVAYFAESNLVISEPDGKQRTVIRVQGEAGLATPSPDGKAVAYVTFDPKPMNLRPDLLFYGGTTVWVSRLSQQEEPLEVTRKDSATTCDIRWLNNDELVFDRIEDRTFMKQARLWKVSVPSAAKTGAKAQ